MSVDLNVYVVCEQLVWLAPERRSTRPLICAARKGHRCTSCDISVLVDESAEDLGAPQSAGVEVVYRDGCPWASGGRPAPELHRRDGQDAVDDVEQHFVRQPSTMRRAAVLAQVDRDALAALVRRGRSTKNMSTKRLPCSSSGIRRVGGNVQRPGETDRPGPPRAPAGGLAHRLGSTTGQPHRGHRGPDRATAPQAGRGELHAAWRHPWVISTLIMGSPARRHPTRLRAAGPNPMPLCRERRQTLITGQHLDTKRLTLMNGHRGYRPQAALTSRSGRPSMPFDMMNHSEARRARASTVDMSTGKYRLSGPAKWSKPQGSPGDGPVPPCSARAFP